MNLGYKITCKQKNRFQPVLSKVVGLSGEIVGRHKRNETFLSLELVNKIADTFEFPLDYPADEGDNASFD